MASFIEEKLFEEESQHDAGDGINKDVLDRMASFGVSEKTGFLPENIPLERLPCDFNAWEDLMTILPNRLHANNIRSAVESLPDFDTSKLETERELDRAMLVLSMIGHSYVWGEMPVASVIPKILAKPWTEVARRLDRPPILSCDSICNQNWGKFDPSKPIELGNIYVLNQFLGGVDEAWFYLITIAIEAKGAEALEAVCAAQQNVEFDKPQELLENLTTIHQTLQKMHAVLSRMEERCEPFIFYHRIRHFLCGWTSGAFSNEGGVIYEGEFNNAPQQWHGGSAAQSALIPIFDALFGVSHQSEQSKDYLQEMRKYIPVNFRRFILSVETSSSVRSYILTESAAVRKSCSQKSSLLKEKFNACVKTLTEFRNFHIILVAKFIVSQSRKKAERGTGGTTIMPFLKSSRDETAASSVNMEL